MGASIKRCTSPIDVFAKFLLFFATLELIAFARTATVSLSSLNPAIVILPSAKLPKFIVPVVVIALEPVSIVPKPDVIEPEFGCHLKQFPQ